MSAIFLYADWQACELVEGTLKNVIMGLLMILLIIFGIVFSYVFPLLAQFDNTIKITIKNAFFMSVSNIRKTIMILTLNAIPFLLYKILPNTFIATFPLWFIFGIGVISYFNAKMFRNIFDKYIDGQSISDEDTVAEKERGILSEK